MRRKGKGKGRLKWVKRDVLELKVILSQIESL